MKNQSLQDQLLSAGLISEAKAKQARSDKRKQRKNKTEVVDEAKKLAQEKKKQQTEKDRQLNEQRNISAHQQQITNQVKQLIEANRITAEEGEDEVAYHFNDGNKVKTIYIDNELRHKIIAGKVAIVRQDHQYELVANEIAEKIAVRQPEAVLVKYSPEGEKSGDEQYSDYRIPDDLMW